MPQLYDCTCRLRFQVQDAAELHRLVESFQRLADERDEVVGAMFANEPNEERVDLTLTAQDVATARMLAKNILAEIEQYLVVHYGPEAVRSEEVVIREITEDGAGGFQTPPNDGFGERLSGELRSYRRNAIEDPEAALRIAQTSGSDGHPTTNDILAKLDEWRVFSRFDVVEVGSHNLTLYFHQLPHQLHRFAEEVLLFCHEVVDEVDALEDLEQAPPAVVARVATEGIAENLKQDPTLRLWWD